MKLPIRIFLTAAVASATLVACSSNKPKPTTSASTDTGTTSTGTQSKGAYTPESLDTDSCLLTRERAERGVGPGEPPAWIVPLPLCRRLARAGVRRLSVGADDARALLSRLLEGR